MKIPKECLIEKCVSTDETRYILNAVFTEKTGETTGVAVATDGRMMAIIPIEFEPGDEPGMIPLAAVAAARKACGKKAEHVHLSPNGTVSVLGKDGETMTFKRTEGTYPKYKQVIPTYEPTVKVALDPQLLAKLAEALGSPGCVSLGVRVEAIDKLESAANAALDKLRSLQPSDESEWSEIIALRHALNSSKHVLEAIIVSGKVDRKGILMPMRLS